MIIVYGHTQEKKLQEYSVLG